jgi:hypothetical protein
MEQTIVSYDGFVANQEVKIRGERGTFKIRSFRVEEGVCLWVTVIGGTSGHSAFRHFSYDRLIRPKQGRRKNEVK